MDYKQAESMQRRAAQWLGTTIGLKDAKELGVVYFLLGEPKGNKKAYARAKALLGETPVRHRLVEESEVGQFGRELLQLIEDQDH